MKVLKFGGTSVANANTIKQVAQIVAKSKEPPAPFFTPTPSVQKKSEEEVQTKDSEEVTIQEKPVVM